MRKTRRTSERGQTLILVALAVPLFLGMALVVVDGSRLFIEKRSVQSATDAAALAAARELNATDTACTGDDQTAGTCTYNVRTIAEAYARSNGWSGSLHACSGSTDTNCYLTPYPSGASPGNQRVQVRLQTDMSTFFGEVVSTLTGDVISSILHPAARAAAAKEATTKQQCVVNGQVVAGWQPGDPCEATTGGGQALMFARCGWGQGGDTGSPADPCTGTSNECTAMHISGSNNTFEGAIISNGGVQNSGANFGAPPKGDAGLYYGPQIDKSKCLKTSGTWSAIDALVKRIDWPVPPPTLTCSDGKTYGGTVTAPNLPYACPAGTYPTKVNGVNCTLLGVDKFTVNSSNDPSGQPWNGLYCAGGALTINKTGITITNAGFIAPSITWSSGTNVASGYTGLFSQYGGLFLDAYSNTGGLNWSGSKDAWTGAIFVPNDNAQVSGGGVQGVCAGVSGVSACGFIEGQTVQESGSDGTWHGLGPTVGGQTVQGTIETTVLGESLALAE